LAKNHFHLEIRVRSKVLLCLRRSGQHSTSTSCISEFTLLMIITLIPYMAITRVLHFVLNDYRKSSEEKVRVNYTGISAHRRVFGHSCPFSKVHPITNQAFLINTHVHQSTARVRGSHLILRHYGNGCMYQDSTRKPQRSPRSVLCQPRIEGMAGQYDSQTH
jgi:hypothetical protein